ncbi:histidinol-phosphatase, inositol monophosphatase family [Tistlia consotensis]|uniref:Histidinol-phosphatase, inositol monophosphatase family n=1 Tax=Tistlia consotensis USBA 355 TaxID=560819 RepID=A0A1Y6BFN7_9PROT|nr:inositol monophosphatase family protein [Tistlia consotensis]SMF07523.1 histidinol-phosphatase, inositol monophosphatase family [Tistlia consotensis USBA 355]SNR35831.1 histidinol-phosphatase, inositol monophosphatase family [Tistlia consotensis]
MSQPLPPEALPEVPEAFVEVAGLLADAASAVTRGWFRGDFRIEDKADESPVTVADRAAEQVMRAILAERLPQHGIVGEEWGSERTDAEWVWVLDPIDGTRAFVTGNPLFGTLVGLAWRGRPCLGVIEMPILGERWLGAAGRPTRFTDERGSRAVGTRDVGGLEQAILRCTSPSMFEGESLAAFDRLRGAVKSTLYGGDLFCYGQLASGFVDLVCENQLQPYDFMALVPVLTGAGATVTDWSGRPMGLGSKGDILVAATPALHAAALSRLAG